MQIWPIFKHDLMTFDILTTNDLIETHLEITPEVEF